MAQTKTLITGGCGFLGSNIAAQALRRGDAVFVIDALLRVGGRDNKAWLEGIAAEAAAAGASLTHGDFDMANEGAVNAFFEENGPFDNIAHLAGQVAMTTSMADPRRDFLTNAVGTFNVLEATRKYSSNAVLVYSSTNKVYGELTQYEYEEAATRYHVKGYPEGFDESIPLDFSSPYGCSKGSADQYVRDWHRNFGLNTLVFRHSSIYGGRQFSTFDQGWVGWFCMKALEQRRARAAGETPEPFTIAGNGKQVRDVLHAEDLVALYGAAFAHGRECAGSVFNIGGGMANSLSLLELFALLEELTGTELAYRETEWRHSDQRVFVSRLDSARQKLGWEPGVSAREGVTRQVEWAGRVLQEGLAK